LAYLAFLFGFALAFVLDDALEAIAFDAGFNDMRAIRDAIE
jgi:hypothetical protein